MKTQNEIMTDYPKWTCCDCAEKAGGKIPDGHLATWHTGKCPVCGEGKLLTEPRDYRYPKFVKGQFKK